MRARARVCPRGRVCERACLHACVRACVRKRLRTLRGRPIPISHNDDDDGAPPPPSSTTTSHTAFSVNSADPARPGLSQQSLFPVLFSVNSADPARPRRQYIRDEARGGGLLEAAAFACADAGRPAADGDAMLRALLRSLEAAGALPTEEAL